MRMLLAVLLLLNLACKKPVVALPLPPARLVVRFLDRDAVLDLAALPVEGPWRFLNVGQWEALEVRWKAGTPRIGAALVPRTAPDWVLLEDPTQETHRVIIRAPGPEDLAQRNGRMDPQERDALSLLGVLWVLGWVRR